MYKRPYYRELEEKTGLVGVVRLVTSNIKSLCCSGYVFAGERYKIISQTSENRVVVERADGGGNCHKVKLSTFMVNSQPVPIETDDV